VHSVILKLTVPTDSFIFFFYPILNTLLSEAPF
jgi:hypothetical protein